MINHTLRCLYVHIPKTAGNSINRVFGLSWENHKDLQRYAAELPPDVLGSYFKFAIVRNPWDRLFSDYNYQRKKSRARDSKLFLHDDAGRRRNFREWVRAALGDPHRYEPGQWGGEVSPGLHRWSPQLDWITIDGRPRLDFVARMEHLPEDFAAICQALKMPAMRLPRRNRRWHGHYSWYYDDATRELVADYYARDIAVFGYRFESSPGCAAWQRLQARTASWIAGWQMPATVTALRGR
jgi:hypothetical protein